jgi:hypothetical protein
VRHLDKASFDGWVANFTNQCIEVETPNERGLAVGQRFSFEVAGRLSAASFEAVLLALDSLEATIQRFGNDVQVVNLLTAGALCETLTFKVEGSLRYSTQNQSFRIRTGSMTVMIEGPSQPVEATIIDASERGFGFVSGTALEPSSTPTAFEVSTPLGPVAGRGLVRYSRPDQANPGKFRGGILMCELGRLDGTRWLRFIREMS